MKFYELSIVKRNKEGQVIEADLKPSQFKTKAKLKAGIMAALLDGNSFDNLDVVEMDGELEDRDYVRTLNPVNLGDTGY